MDFTFCSSAATSRRFGFKAIAVMVKTSLMFVVQRPVATAPTLMKTRAARKRFQRIRIAGRLACVSALALPRLGNDRNRLETGREALVAERRPRHLDLAALDGAHDEQPGAAGGEAFARPYQPVLAV